MSSLVLALAVVVIHSTTRDGALLERSGFDRAAVSTSAALPAGRHSEVLRIPPDDPLTPRHLDALRSGSSTARALLERIARLPRTILIVRAHPALAGTTGILGRGRLWVSRGYLYGFLEYQSEPVGSRRALRVLAHELAHALEAALAPRDGTTRQLAATLTALDVGRDFAHVDPPGIETDFALAVGRRVHAEVRGGLKGAPSALEALAAVRALSLADPQPLVGVPNEAAPHPHRED